MKRHLGLCAWLLAAHCAATAGTAAGAFVVKAHVKGICISTTLSALTNATVKVVCETGQFVSIEPTPGKPFPGTHGGAYRFTLAPGSVMPLGLSGAENDPHIGHGTITALRIANLNVLEDRLEILVSF